MNKYSRRNTFVMYDSKGVLGVILFRNEMQILVTPIPM